MKSGERNSLTVSKVVKAISTLFNNPFRSTYKAAGMVQLLVELPVELPERLLERLLVLGWGKHRPPPIEKEQR